MKKRRIALTRQEAATIAQRALLEMISGKPGIWMHLNERIRPDRRREVAGAALFGRRRKRPCTPRFGQAPDVV